MMFKMSTNVSRNQSMLILESPKAIYKIVRYRVIWTKYNNAIFPTSSS